MIIFKRLFITPVNSPGPQTYVVPNIPLHLKGGSSLLISIEPEFQILSNLWTIILLCLFQLFLVNYQSHTRCCQVTEIQRFNLNLYSIIRASAISLGQQLSIDGFSTNNFSRLGLQSFNIGRCTRSIMKMETGSYSDNYSLHFVIHHYVPVVYI